MKLYFKLSDEKTALRVSAYSKGRFGALTSRILQFDFIKRLDILDQLYSN